MFCKPNVKLILECLWAEKEICRVEIRQCTIEEITGDCSTSFLCKQA